MTHLTGREFPRRIALDAVTVSEWGTEEIRTDGGFVITNQRWEAPLLSFELAMPIMLRDDEDYLEFLDLWEDSAGGVHSFDYVDHRDPTHSTVIAVRFATPIRTTAVTPDYEKVDTFILEEVRLPVS